MKWLDNIRERAKTSTLGTSDIPWWVGLLLFVGLLYLAAVLPSELKPLAVLGTVPYSGARNVPADTVLVVKFGVNGFKDTFGDLEPVVDVRYDNAAGRTTISTTLSYTTDELRAVPSQPLPLGKRVQVGVRTQFDRDLLWHFTVTTDPAATLATPLPPLE